MTRRQGVLVHLAGAVLLLAATGCTQKADTLDRAATERAVKTVVGARIESPVAAIGCPEEIERGEGEAVVCRAELADDAGTVRLRVTQTATAGGLEVALLDAVLDRDEVAEDLRQNLVKTYLRTFEVDCGEPAIAVLAPDSTLTCDAEDGTERREVTVTVTDASGTLRYDIGR